MRIGILSTVESCKWAGSEETWRLFALQALRCGHQVTLLVGQRVAESDQVAELRQMGATVLRITPLGVIRRRLVAHAGLNRYKKFFSDQHDVVFLSMGGAVDAIWRPDLIAALTRTQIPIVLFVQANAEAMVGSEAEREKLRLLYGIPKKVIFLSRHNQELLERQIGESVVNAVRIMNPLRSQVEKILPWPSHEPVFGMAEVGRLELADKQQDHLLKALSGDVWKNRNWKLTFYGNGPDEAHIRRLIKFYDLSEKVKLGGFVSDFQDIWRENHLHILPSRREGMPLSLIESMACARPALVTRAGGSAELVEHGISGWVSSGMHPEVLRETLEIAWSNRGRWKVMGGAARARILSTQEPDWAELMLKVINDARCNVV